MTRSTPCPVVLRPARGKLPGLVVPSAIHGTFRKVTEGIPCSRKVNVCFSALQEVENMTLASFLEHHEDPFRKQDLHPMNIIDLDIDPHQRTTKHTVSIPNLIKDYSLGHTYTSRMDPSIREEFDFTLMDQAMVNQPQISTGLFGILPKTSSNKCLMSG